MAGPARTRHQAGTRRGQPRPRDGQRDSQRDTQRDPQRGNGRDRPRRSRVDAARRAAYDVLRAVADRDAYANLLLPALLTERGLTGRDAAFATELTYGTLRGRGTYDAILAACSDRDQVDPPVRDILRLGAHQLLATRVGSHAAVATSVDLAKDVVGPRPSGFVNAVLRRVATRDLDAWLEIAAPSRDRDLTGHLAVRYSYPAWIIDAYRDALGDAAQDELEDALAAGNLRPEVVLAITPPATTAPHDRAVPRNPAAPDNPPAPSAASTSATARPIPLLPPVTTAVASVNPRSTVVHLLTPRTVASPPDVIGRTVCSRRGAAPPAWPVALLV
jgi:transcription termination factor NusB